MLCRVAAIKRLLVHYHCADNIFSSSLGSLSHFSHLKIELIILGHRVVVSGEEDFKGFLFYFLPHVGMVAILVM